MEAENLVTVRLEELLAAATPGPWNVRAEPGTGLYDVWFGDSLDSASISYAAMSVERADAALIALAPDAVRLLIDMGEALRAMRDLIIVDEDGAAEAIRMEDWGPVWVHGSDLLARMDRLGNTT